MDYDAKFDTTFVFDGNESMEQCCNISSVNDGFVENEELFFVQLTSVMMLVDIPIPSAQVNIRDNDSELYQPICLLPIKIYLQGYCYSSLIPVTQLVKVLMKYKCV